MIRSLHHVGLTLPEPKEGGDFYAAFGLDLEDTGGKLVARCHGRDQAQVVITEGPKRGFQYLSFGGRADDMARTKKALEARGITLLDPPHATTRGVATEGIWFRDPDGNLIHLGTDAPVPPRKALPVTTNTSSANVRVNERGCLEHGTEAKPIRLAHVILFSPDPARQVAFYTETLGMKLSDRVGDDMVMFMRGASDGDHHLLGILRSPKPGLHHASFEMDSLDHIELAAQKVKAAGYKHVWGTGRHTVGSNLFHYFRDPWGSLAEYSHDLDFIPEGAVWEARSWPKERGLFLWSSDGPPPPDFPQNLAQDQGGG
jgi:catechol 2,3-dioxygenase-like lactoylglutathione lyase family enzyme